MTKTYSNKQNAVRAARKEFGPSAILGEDFTVSGLGHGWTYERTTADEAPLGTALAEADAISRAEIVVVTDTIETDGDQKAWTPHADSLTGDIDPATGLTWEEGRERAEALRAAVESGDQAKALAVAEDNRARLAEIEGVGGEVPYWADANVVPTDSLPALPALLRRTDGPGVLEMLAKGVTLADLPPVDLKTPTGMAEEARALAEAKKARTRTVGGPSKMGAILEALQGDGITTAEIEAQTGWTKFGGIYTAAAKAGLKVQLLREGKTSRWFGVPADEKEVRAYSWTGERWIAYGTHVDASAAAAAAVAESKDSAEVDVTVHRSGAVLIKPRA